MKSTPAPLDFSIPFESINLKKGISSEVYDSIFLVIGQPKPVGKFTFNCAFIKVVFPTPAGPTKSIFKCSNVFTLSKILSLTILNIYILDPEFDLF